MVECFLGSTSNATESALVPLDVLTLSSERLMYEITNLVPGQPYYVQVKAMNSVGFSKSASSMPLELGLKPDPIEQSTCTLSTIAADSSVSVLESSSSLLASFPNGKGSGNGSAISSYLLEYWASGNELNYKSVEIDADSHTTIAHTLTGLTAGQPYDARISAQNALGYSKPCPSVPATLAPPKQTPSQPTDVSLVPDSGQSLRVLFSHSESDGGDAITQYKLEWDTESSFDSNNGSPLGHYSRVMASRIDCPCEQIISGLTKGVGYFVRVYAYNSFRYFFHAITSPKSLSPKSQPLLPEMLRITPNSTSSLSVIFPKSLDDGGAPVTKYKIKWNAVGHIDIASPGSTDPRTALYAPYTIQAITSCDLAGAFRVAFQGHATKSISATCTANDLKVALESLPTIGQVSVSRKELSTDENNWLVTFLTKFYGDMVRSRSTCLHQTRPLRLCQRQQKVL